MNLERTILLICFITLLNFSARGQTIFGKVVDNNEVIEGAETILHDSAGIKNKGARSDINGEFQIKNIKPGIYSLKVYYIGKPNTLFKNIQINNDTSIVLNIHKYCEFDKSKNDKTCPKCKKQDKVLPIVYGLLVSTKGEGKEFISGGCNVTFCEPNWYCKRDDLSF